jgi:hypothetical protein
MPKMSKKAGPRQSDFGRALAGAVDSPTASIRMAIKSIEYRFMAASAQ